MLLKMPFKSKSKIQKQKAQQLSQPVDEEQIPLCSQVGSPDGAREQFPQPSFTSEGNEVFVDPPPKRTKAGPEATFTPTAVGLRPRESQGPEMDDQMKRMISEAIAQGIAAGLQQTRQAAPVAPETSLHQDQYMASPHQMIFQGSHSTLSSTQSRLSLLGDEDHEGMAPNTQDFARLFRPALFKSLLFKAKASVHLGADSATKESALDPSELLFSEPIAEIEEIPSPKLFQDVVQRQWVQLGASASANALDKRFYNMAPDFMEILQPPTVDDPVVALTSSTILSNEDALNPEDKRGENALRNLHQAAAWAIKSATAASFFNRASLLWLRQLQARVPSSDLHQDINKLIAAMEFSADASLDVAKFASRAIASSVVARRLLWLRQWQADMKFKWKLASAPFKGSKLFGEALEPILMETKDGKKVLPYTYRRDNSRTSPYFRRPSFQPTDTGFDTPQPQRAYAPRHNQQQNRSGFRDRNRQQFQSKQQFRGTGNGPFRHSN